MPTKWVRAGICCPKHFHRNVTDPKGAANFQKPLQWNHYILQILTHLLRLCTDILSISQVDFLSFNISGRGAVRNWYIRSVSLVCRRNIPQIIRPLNVSDSQSQGPHRNWPSTSVRSKRQKRGRHSNWELNQYHTWGSENGECPPHTTLSKPPPEGQV